MQKFIIWGTLPTLVTGVVLSLALSASAVPKAVKKQPTTLGTTQMAGGDALLGHTYTYNASYPISQPINLTIKSVEYSVERINFNVGEDHYAPTADQKLFINPLPHQKPQ